MSIRSINPWHIVVGLVLALAAMLVWNASLRRSYEEQIILTQQLERDLKISKQAEKNKTVERVIITKKPDGTEIKETVREEKNSKVSTDIADKEKVSTTTTKTVKVENDRTRYSVGAYMDMNRTLSASVGFALGDLPLELVILGTDNLTQVSAGVQFRW